MQKWIQLKIRMIAIRVPVVEIGGILFEHEKSKRV